MAGKIILEAYLVGLLTYEIYIHCLYNNAKDHIKATISW